MNNKLEPMSEEELDEMLSASLLAEAAKFTYVQISTEDVINMINELRELRSYVDEIQTTLESLGLDDVYPDDSFGSMVLEIIVDLARDNIRLVKKYTQSEGGGER